MAFTNAPQNSTYKTETIKFDDTATYRSGNLSVRRDSAIWNMFYDRVSQENQQRETTLKKRPGMRQTDYHLNKANASDVLRGFFYDASSDKFYWAVNDKVYSVTPDSGSSTRTVTTLTTSSGYVGFCEFLQASTGKRFVIFSDGTELWVDDYAASSCSKVTSPDLPTPHVPTPVQLDGYIFLAKANTNDIYNSNNDDPTAWDAGDYISAEMSGDYITWLSTARNYLVGFGVSSMEMFWNAAQVSGSPMKRYEGGFKSVGFTTGLCKMQDVLYFVGQDLNKNIAVYALDGFKLDKVSNEVVDRSIQTITTTDNAASQLYLNRDGYSISSDGHTFYAIVTPQTTWVYDINEKFWYEWRASNGNKLDIQASWAQTNGSQYLAVDGRTHIAKMSPEIYQDFGVNFTCRYITQDLTFGTMNWKMCPRLMLVSDMHNYVGVSNVQVSWSDNDWGDGGTAGPFDLNVFSSSPFIHRLGRFRNRSFKLEYTDNYPIRFKSMELDLNVGAH